MIAEIILGAVEQHLITQGVDLSSGCRWIDDYELCFDSVHDAEEALSVLQQALSEYELDLNHSKTSICQLPYPLEEQWVRVLRQSNLAYGLDSVQEGRQVSELIGYFDDIWRFRKRNSKHYLKFGLNKIARMNCWSGDAWKALEALISQSMFHEPGNIPVCLTIIKNRDNSDPIDKELFKCCFEGVIKRSSIAGLDSEVAWSLYAASVLGIELTSEVIEEVKKTKDGVSLSLCYALIENGELKISGSRPKFSESDSNSWLWRYEHKLASERSFGKEDSFLNSLLSKKISFIDIEKGKSKWESSSEGLKEASLHY